MITKAEKEKIKEILGWRYAPVVQEYMTKKGFLNSKGEPYSTAMISNVMNGNSHERIESAIFDLVAKKKMKIAARKRYLE